MAPPGSVGKDFSVMSTCNVAGLTPFILVAASPSAAGAMAPFSALVAIVAETLELFVEFTDEEVCTVNAVCR